MIRKKIHFESRSGKAYEMEQKIANQFSSEALLTEFLACRGDIVWVEFTNSRRYMFWSARGASPKSQSELIGNHISSNQ